MKAMILAAGRGERMRPLTDTLPKPLLKARGRTLIDYHLEKLAAAGVREVIINHGRLGRQIEQAVGTECYGMKIIYSAEGDEPLDTGGGIFRALPLLGTGPFILVNADVWSDMDYARLPQALDAHAHLVLVPNPAHHIDGDFALKGRYISLDDGPRHTYGGMGVFQAALFDECSPGRFPLAPLLRQAASHDLLTGHLYEGRWLDIGTPERLHELEQSLKLDVLPMGS